MLLTRVRHVPAPGPHECNFNRGRRGWEVTRHVVLISVRTIREATLRTLNVRRFVRVKELWGEDTEDDAIKLQRDQLQQKQYCCAPIYDSLRFATNAEQHSTQPLWLPRLGSRRYQ